MLEGKKTYIAAALLLAYQAFTGDFASAIGTFNSLVGPLLMILMRKVTKTPAAF
jgi:hypothetical protein